MPFFMNLFSLSASSYVCEVVILRHDASLYPVKKVPSYLGMTTNVYRSLRGTKQSHSMENKVYFQGW